MTLFFEFFDKYDKPSIHVLLCVDDVKKLPIESRVLLKQLEQRI